VTTKIITTGINNDDYIEVTGGLNEGDIILIPVKTSSTNTRTTQQGGFGMMGVGGGGMPPTGGMQSGTGQTR
jgi:HlyD family secretion protein